MSSDMEKDAWMHLYPQQIWHDNAKIIGNHEALTRLSIACSAAAHSGRGRVVAHAIDGEGYELIVERTNTTGLRYTRLPYVDKTARTREPDYAEGLRKRIADLEEQVATLRSALLHRNLVG